jgi:YcaO-like protein with predicted kinase domain
LWHRRPAAARDATRLDLGTVADSDCQAVVDRLRQAELEVVVWDITSDVGAPAFHCEVLDRTGEIGHVGRGTGCHPVSEVALLRALTEAAQVRLTYIAGSREDLTYADYRPATLAARCRGAMARGRPVDPMRDFAAVGRFVFDDFASELAWILDRLAAAGFRQVVAVDLTQAAFGVSVVWLVIPGLEGSDHLPDYVPGARARAIAAGLP